MTRESRAPLIVAIVLLLLPVVYVGSYLALVVPGGYMNGRLNISSTMRLPNYRAGNQWAKTAYWPLEEIDRKVRPRAWAPFEVNAISSGGFVEEWEHSDP